jgi:hypothetical protein
MALMALSRSLSWSATPAELQTAKLPAIKGAVLSATRYPDNAVDLTLKENQFWVTVVNSDLNAAPPHQRELQASQIVAVITKAIRHDPAFAKTLGIHIDYVARSTQGGHADIVDSIDFRKGPAGNFMHHTT